MSDVTLIVFESGEVLTVKSGTAFPIIRKSGTVESLTDRMGSGSRTVTIDGSKDNIIVLGGLFDVNLIDGSFDINAKSKCDIIQSGVNVFPRAYFKLQRVKLRKDRHTTDVDRVTFEGLVYNEVADAFKEMGNKELTDLKIGEPANYHTLNYTNVNASITNDYTDGFCYPTMWKDNNVYKVSDFKPAIFYRTIWDAIWESIGWTYTWASIDDNDIQFSSWISPFVDKFTPTEDQILAEIVDIGTDLNPDPNVSESEFGFAQLTYPSFSKWYPYLTDENGQPVGPNPYPGVGSIAAYMDIIGVENLDPKSQYNTATGVFTANLTGVYDLDFTVDFTVDLQVAANATMDISSGGVFRYNFAPFVVDNAAGTALTPSGQAIQLDYYDGDTLTSGSNLTTGTYKGRIVLDLNAGDTVDLMGWLLKMEGDGNGRWTATAGGAPINVEPNFTADSINVKILPRVNYQEGMTIDLNAFIPKKIKQSDFVKSVMTMAHLIPVDDPDNERNVILYKRDDYYDNGTQRDFSKKLAVDKDFDIEFLPNVNSKAIELSYKDDKDVHNVSYLNTVKETYGQLRFIFENENVKGTDRQTVIFSPTPVGQAAFGGYCPYIPLTPDGLNMRVLLWNASTAAGDYYFIEQRDGTLNNPLNYGQAHHLDDPLFPGFDLNFGICKFYFYQGINPTINNLFNLHYRRLFKQLNNGKRATAYFDLSLADKVILQMNDRIYVNNSWWEIEQIEQDVNSVTLTKTILLSLDDETKIKPVRGRINTEPLPQQGIQGIISSGDQVVTAPDFGLSEWNDLNNNVFGGDNGGTTASGEGNVIQAGVKGTKVQGDNNTVNASKVFVFGDNIEANKEGMYVNEMYIDGRSIRQLAQGGNVVIATGADYEIDPEIDDYVELTAASSTAYLPDPTLIIGRVFVIKNMSSNVASVDAGAGQSIDGTQTINIPKKEARSIKSNGVNWVLV